jgi:hypothetical protein
MPQGLLHAPTRGGNNGSRQYKELARRFVMWRQRDMGELIKIWQAATIKARNILTKRDEMRQKGNRARIDMVMRLLRKGAISKAGKALESKGLGDLRNHEIIQQLRGKHPMRIREIGPGMYTFVPEELVELKVEKILEKLKSDAAPGPTGLRNNQLRMWMGAFAPATMESAIERLDDLITNMANDRLPSWFMQAMQRAELLAIIKTEGRGSLVGDHMPVVIPNTISKITDKAMLQECHEDYMAELLPQQLGVGVKFAADLLAMGIRMTLH